MQQHKKNPIPTCEIGLPLVFQVHPWPVHYGGIGAYIVCDQCQKKIKLEKRFWRCVCKNHQSDTDICKICGPYLPIKIIQHPVEVAQKVKINLTNNEKNSAEKLLWGSKLKSRASFLMIFENMNCSKQNLYDILLSLKPNS